MNRSRRVSDPFMKGAPVSRPDVPRPKVVPANEYDRSFAIANAVLDRHYEDPDSDLCVLARQLLRERWRNSAMGGQLAAFRVLFIIVGACVVGLAAIRFL